MKPTSENLIYTSEKALTVSGAKYFHWVLIWFLKVSIMCISFIIFEYQIIFTAAVEFYFTTWARNIIVIDNTNFKLITWITNKNLI